MAMLLIIFIILGLVVLSSVLDSDSATKTIEDFCNLECLSRKVNKKCCDEYIS